MYIVVPTKVFALEVQKDICIHSYSNTCIHTSIHIYIHIYARYTELTRNGSPRHTFPYQKRIFTKI